MSCASRYAAGSQRCLLWLGRGDIEDYLWTLAGIRGLRSSTIARRRAALAGFYREAVEEGLRDDSPVKSMRQYLLGRPSQPVRGFDRLQLQALLAASQRHSDRAHAVVATLTYTGVRIGELLGADIDDLGKHNGVETLRVRRKGGSTAIVAVPGPAATAIRESVADRRVGPVIVSRTGRRLDRGNAGKLIKAVASDAFGAAMADEVHAHRFRHAWVSGLLDAGIPLHEVQRAAGHASPTTTMRYDRLRTDVGPQAPSLRLVDWLTAT